MDGDWFDPIVDDDDENLFSSSPSTYLSKKRRRQKQPIAILKTTEQHCKRKEQVQEDDGDDAFFDGSGDNDDDRIEFTPVKIYVVKKKPTREELEDGHCYKADKGMNLPDPEPDAELEYAWWLYEKEPASPEYSMDWSKVLPF